MKTRIRKYTGKVITVFMFLTLVVACNKLPFRDGSVTVRLTDAPADFVKVNVDITGFEVNHETKGWISLPINQGIYNLLELRNNVSVVLANNVEVPVGKISQIRLVLGSRNSVEDSFGIYDLKVPSGSESGLKLNIDQVITSNQSLDILIDFDANASIVSQGNGEYILKPVLKIKSIQKIKS